MRNFLQAFEDNSERLAEGEQVSCEVYTPPEAVKTDKTTVFLAGTIDMGESEDWQTRVVGEFTDTEVCFLNPRRAAWDKSWVQDITNDKFRGQVEWELDYQDTCDHIVMYFDPASKAPITLLELGLAVQYPEKVIVACPKGYWRRGNVQIVCERYNITLVDTLEEMISALREVLK